MYKTFIQLVLFFILILIIFFIFNKYFYAENKIQKKNDISSLNIKDKEVTNENLNQKKIKNEIINLTYEKLDKFGNKYFIEAKKRVFEDRAKYYADMDMSEVPVEELLSKTYARANYEALKPQASNYLAGEISAGETTYLTVADRDGNMISLIQSNYRGMGSGMVPPGLGFMLQDRGELF